MDWAGGGVAFKDVYLEWADIPVVGKLRAGHYKEPVGIESMNSRRFLMFMERSSISEACWAERNAGVSIGDAVLNDRMTWTATFANVDNGSGDGVVDSNCSLVARITGIAYENPEKAQLIHLEVSGAPANTKDDSIRFRSRPESHIAPRFIDTGAIAADSSYTVAAAEAAAVWGTFSIQGEYMHKVVDTLAMGDLEFGGDTVTTGYFLTGESRKYKKSSDAFERVTPKKNFSLSGDGPGAIQLALRYSSLDLNDGPVAGGEMDTITAGINWHLNPNTREMLNYIYADVEPGAGADFDAHIVQGRLQIDF